MTLKEINATQLSVQRFVIADFHKGKLIFKSEIL